MFYRLPPKIRRRNDCRLDSLNTFNVVFNATEPLLPWLLLSQWLLIYTYKKGVRFCKVHHFLLLIFYYPHKSTHPEWQPLPICSPTWKHTLYIHKICICALSLSLFSSQLCYSVLIFVWSSVISNSSSHFQ